MSVVSTPLYGTKFYPGRPVDDSPSSPTSSIPNFWDKKSTHPEMTQSPGNKNALLVLEREKRKQCLIVDDKVAKAWCYGHGGFVSFGFMEADHLQPAASRSELLKEVTDDKKNRLDSRP